MNSNGKVIINGSIVLYKSDKSVLLNIIKAFTESDCISKLYLIDNSPTDELRCLSFDKIVYFHFPNNLGFGAAHNIAFKESLKEEAHYHFVINPDVEFETCIIKTMVDYMGRNQDVGMMMPQVLNLDKSIQFLPKLLPSPYSILMRKLRCPNFMYDPFVNKYELRYVSEEIIYEAPILSGCFTLFRLSAIKKLGMYDDKFFMYFEDWDLSRRIHKEYKTIYYPEVSVYHEYTSGANKNRRLFQIFIKSAIYYFNKWGWFFDRERKQINKKTLSQFSRK